MTDPVNHSTASTLQPIDSPKCWNSREIVAMDLYRVINFKGRSLESNLKKQEQQLPFYVEAKRGNTRTERAVDIILRHLGMEQMQDCVKASFLDCLKDTLIASG